MTMKKNKQKEGKKIVRKHPDGMVYLGQGLLKEWVLGRMKEQLKDIQVICLDSLSSLEEYHSFLVRIPSYSFKEKKKKARK